jgi:hypothetical protein
MRVRRPPDELHRLLGLRAGDHVNLGFDRAAELPQPTRLLAGTGARMGRA